jgi:hypothetical protein
MCKKMAYLAAVVSILTIFEAGAANAQDASTVGWWKFDETSGNIAYDSNIRGNHGTLAGGPVWTTGHFGGALEFDGVDDYVDLPIGSVIGSLTDVTFTTWVNFYNMAGYWQRIFDFGNGPVTYLFLTAKGQLSTGEEPIIFGVGNNAWQDEDRVVGPNTLPTDWHHIAVTLDYENRIASMYLDGQFIADNNSIRYGPSTVGETTQNWLGKSQYESDTYFNGSLDDFRIYDYPLGESEIRVVMEGGSLASGKPARPNPFNKATEVIRDVILKWRPGSFAAKHDVYLGTDFNDVNEAGRDNPLGVLVAENQDEVVYDPPGLLDYGQTYYWRVDGVNAPPESTIHRGEVWSFTVRNFIIVDSFEDYNDNEPHRIFDTWIDGWEDENNGAVVGYAEPDFDNDEHFIETNVVHGGTQSMPFFYDNNGKFSEALLKLSGTASDWTIDGVEFLSLWLKGYPAYVGGFVEEPPDTYTMTSTGTDIWGFVDEFHFAYKEVTGTCTIIAKVESVENTDPFAKAGVMIRNSLEPDAANIALLITPENGVRYQYRNTNGGTTERDFDPNVAAPYWLKLQRTSGGLVRAYYSSDNVTWASFTLRTITMSAPIYIGLAVTSHNTEAVCEAKFSNVSFPDTSVGQEWAAQDIGIISNSAEPMYVILNDSAIIYHDLPNASQIRNWTQWLIPLQRFVDLGVNLSSVNSLGIGFGDRNNPQSGGQGIVFFDDIRLYRPPAQ